MFNCTSCNKPFIWQNDHSFDEIGIDDKEGIVGIYECNPCKIWIEVYMEGDNAK